MGRRKKLQPSSPLYPFSIGQVHFFDCRIKKPIILYKNILSRQSSKNKQNDNIVIFYIHSNISFFISDYYIFFGKTYVHGILCDGNKKEYVIGLLEFNTFINIVKWSLKI